MLCWTPAVDPAGVIHYRVYLDGLLIATTRGNDWTTPSVPAVSPIAPLSFLIAWDCHGAQRAARELARRRPM
jgi:hypothetical protein